MRAVSYLKSNASGMLGLGYQLAALYTFVRLTFFDGYVYNWWNWIIAIPVNGFMAEIWPIYWFLLRPFFG